MGVDRSTDAFARTRSRSAVFKTAAFSRGARRAAQVAVASALVFGGAPADPRPVVGASLQPAAPDPPPLPSKPTEIREGATVELVLVPVSVRGGDGQPLPGLSREDFVLYEDGLRQEIATFDREPTPVSIVFAIDASGSMDRYIPFVKAAAIRFVERIPRTFSVSLASFSDESDTLSDFTSDRNHLYYEINTLKAEGSGTAILEATRDAIARAARRPGRRAVVLFTDGEENAVPPEERAKAEGETVAHARGAAVTVYYVGYGWVARPQMLERIATATGGEYLAAGRERKITEAFDGIARELDSQYTLGYVPRPGRPGQWRPLRVDVARPDVVVAARAGYLVPAAASLTP